MEKATLRMSSVFGYKRRPLPLAALIWGAAELVALQWSRLRIRWLHWRATPKR